MFFEVAIASGALQAHHCQQCALSSGNTPSPFGNYHEEPPKVICTCPAEPVKKGSPQQNELSFKVPYVQHECARTRNISYSFFLMLNCYLKLIIQYNFIDYDLTNNEKIAQQQQQQQRGICQHSLAVQRILIPHV